METMKPSVREKYPELAKEFAWNSSPEWGWYDMNDLYPREEKYKPGRVAYLLLYHNVMRQRVDDYDNGKYIPW